MCLRMPTIYFNVDDKDNDDDHHKDNDDDHHKDDYDDDHHIRMMNSMSMIVNDDQGNDDNDCKDNDKDNDDNYKLLMMIILQCYLTLALVQTIDSTIPIQY